MPYVVLSSERKVTSQLSIFSLSFNSFVTLADLKSTWCFRIKCWDLLPELSTSASQKVGFVRMPAGAVNTINRRNICSLCWVKEWKQEGLQMNLFPNLCALAGQALSSRQTFTWAIPAHFLGQSKFSKAFLGALSCISAIPKGCLCVSASPGCRGRTQHVNLSALLQQPLLHRLWERAACPVPHRHLLLGSQGPGQGFPSP